MQQLLLRALNNAPKIYPILQKTGNKSNSSQAQHL